MISKSHCEVSIILFVVATTIESPIVYVCVECTLLEYPIQQPFGYSMLLCPSEISRLKKPVLNGFVLVAA